MKILVSAFNSFNGSEFNISEEVLKKLPDGFHKVYLETSYEKSFNKLRKEIDHLKPDLVIMLGEAHKRDQIELEKIAINFIDATIADNDGNLIRHQRIDPKGTDLLTTTLDLERLDCNISYHAGTYVCNYLYYQVLSYLKNLNTNSLFIHLPKYSDITNISIEVEALINKL